MRWVIIVVGEHTEAYHQLQSAIRKVYQGIFKGKKMIDNRVSSHATRLLTNCVIAYNSTFLNVIYQRMIAEGASQSLIDELSRISPIAWSHITFTGRYSFKKNNGKIDLKGMLNTLEAKLRLILWKKGKK